MVNINSPLKEAEKFLIVPKGDERKYKMTIKSGRSVYLQSVTMIDPATDWMEIRAVSSAQADLVAYQVELARVTRYPLRSKVIVDRGPSRV